MLYFYRQYWEGDKWQYICNDTEATLNNELIGIDASDEMSIYYTCVSDIPSGRYNAPRTELNETWPSCITRTTTVKPGKKKDTNDSLTD